MCRDCTVDTGKIREHYFVNTSLWFDAGMGKVGMLCIGCLESRIGRTLGPPDFTDAWINDPKRNDMSPRLLSRLTSP